MEQGSYEPSSDGVPIDLFVSKKLKFKDSSSNIVFSVHRPPPSNPFKRLLSDSDGNPLISISHHQKSSWEGFSSQGNDPMFRVERTTNTLKRVEFQVFLKSGDNKNSDFKMRGSPFFRSCTIYKGDSIVAQTSLMYKLGIQNVLVPRNREFDGMGFNPKRLRVRFSLEQNWNGNQIPSNAIVHGISKVHLI